MRKQVDETTAWTIEVAIRQGFVDVDAAIWQYKYNTLDFLESLEDCIQTLKEGKAFLSQWGYRVISAIAVSPDGERTKLL